MTLLMFSEYEKASTVIIEKGYQSQLVDVLITYLKES